VKVAITVEQGPATGYLARATSLARTSIERTGDHVFIVIVSGDVPASRTSTIVALSISGSAAPVAELASAEAPVIV